MFDLIKKIMARKKIEEVVVEEIAVEEVKEETPKFGNSENTLGQK